MKLRVYPKEKTKYRVGNWPTYERALVQRGDVTLWLSTDAIDAWRPSPAGKPVGRRGFDLCTNAASCFPRQIDDLPLPADGWQGLSVGDV